MAALHKEGKDKGASTILAPAFLLLVGFAYVVITDSNILQETDILNLT